MTTKYVVMWLKKYSLIIGCSTVVEHPHAEQISLGRGFDSRCVLGFILFFLSLSGVSLIRSLEEVQHC